ncbi:MAG: erythromycin esterase family protein [Longimicrobiaceae bacterium]
MRPVATLLFSLLLALLPACGESSPTPPADPELAWLRENAVEFRTAEPGGDYADLMPLEQIIGNARVVALGEATHGTREFFQMKHRILEFLVREMGFTTFGIEATWAESNRVNDYLHTEVGDPAVLLSNLYFWTWNTREVLEMIEWMRRHNQNPGGAPRVSFYGFDMQSVRVTMNDVEAYLQRVDPAALEEVRLRYACYRPYQDVRRSRAGRDRAAHAAGRPGRHPRRRPRARQGQRPPHRHLPGPRHRHRAPRRDGGRRPHLRRARAARQPRGAAAPGHGGERPGHHAAAAARYLPLPPPLALAAHDALVVRRRRYFRLRQR